MPNGGWQCKARSREDSPGSRVHVAFGSTIPGIRRTFCEAEITIVASLVVPLVTPIDEVQVHRCFILAAMIMCAQTESLSRNGKFAMFVHFPGFMGTRWFQKTTDLRPTVRNRSRSPLWCGARRRR